MGSLQVPRVAMFTHKYPNLGGGVCHAGVAIPYACLPLPQLVLIHPHKTQFETACNACK